MMEKSPCSHAGFATPAPSHSVVRRGVHLKALFLVTALLVLIHRSWSPFEITSHQLLYSDREVNRNGGDDGDWLGFDWSSVKPTPDLKYHGCFDGLLCARLSVPLDWFNGTAPNETASIALVKVPAKVPTTDPRYGGPIFINPGGPGGSGTLFAAYGGRQLQRFTDTGPPSSLSAQVVSSSDGGGGSANESYHDIIGFDPRGVGATTPAAYCFDGDEYRRGWLLRLLEEGLPGSSNAALGRLLSIHRAMGATCNARIAQGSSILNYMSTGVVARDMLELAHQEDKWRRHNASSSGPVPPQSDASDVKLSYWGFSYGSLLGATFASMFPDNVGPMILDGVLEPSDFINHHWTGSVEDTEKALQAFYDHCAAAGPIERQGPAKGCELANNGSTPADVRERVQGILMNLYHNPLWFTGPYGPDILSYSTIKGIIFSALYSPIMAFPNLASILVGIERDDKPFVAAFVAQHGLSAQSLPSTSSFSTAGMPLPNDAGTAVECTDSDSFATLDTDAWQYAARELTAVSPAGGALLASMHLRCAGWAAANTTSTTPFRFAGPFGSRKTSTPILWIGNTADPICPIKSARNQAARFEGSVVLQHDATGHCSLAAYSRCTAESVRPYFRDGTLPAPGTVCPVAQVPWDAPLPGKEGLLEETEDGDDQQAVLMETSRGLNELFHGLGLGYGMPMVVLGRLDRLSRASWNV